MCVVFFLVLVVILVVVKITRVFFALLNYPVCDIANHWRMSVQTKVTHDTDRKMTAITGRWRQNNRRWSNKGYFNGAFDKSICLRLHDRSPCHYTSSRLNHGSTNLLLVVFDNEVLLDHYGLISFSRGRHVPPNGQPKLLFPLSPLYLDIFRKMCTHA